jgi:repressor LexA
MIEMALKVRLLRKKLKLNQLAFAELVGVTQPTVSRWERGQDEPQGENLVKLASLAGERVEEFAGYGDSPEIKVKRVTVVGAVQAGVWVEAVEWTLGERYEVSWSPDGKFDAYAKFGLRIRGSSMNQIYPDGAVIICVKFYDLGGRDPRHGERVVVYRRRGNGLLEATVKEFVIDKGRMWLVPRSHDLEHQSPMPFPPDDRGTESVEIHALVVGSYTPESVNP